MKFQRAFLAVLFFSFLLTACTMKQPKESLSSTEEFHLGSHTFPISTNILETQKAFDRGLTLAYAFSYLAAEKEFRQAAELDAHSVKPSPMPWWGIALVNGPHINFPLVPEENAKIAWQALTRAKELKSNGTELEQDLITALESRYQEKQPKDRAKLDLAYAQAMKNLAKKYPRNADVVMLIAEALMDLHPWDLWDNKGNPKSWTPEILATLEQAIHLNNAHPGAHHLYIHAVEASNTPELGVNSADTLGTLVPGAGHLVHMPGHIYVRIGRWEDAAWANLRAIRADINYRKAIPRPGFYGMYMTHNHHFLTFVRMMQGKKENALDSARELIATVPSDFIEKYGPIADGFMAIALKVLMRFGEWEQILKEPEPTPNLPFARALWRFSRATAYTALDRHDEAIKERSAFFDASKLVPPDATFGNNKAHTLLQLAEHVLAGEMAARKNNYEAAIKSLQAAVKIEDSLTYDEPPDWIIPVRHTLGATLLRAGKLPEAEAIYREDLARFPKNGWSLFGLNRALVLQAKEREAEMVQEEFNREWSEADISIETSCLCQPGV